MKALLIGVAVVVVLVVAVGAWAAGVYNGLIGQEQNVNEKWSQVQNVYQRRTDLIPNLVETVKGYASHERATFEEVTNARTRAQQAGSVPEQAAAENVLTAAIGRLFAVAEAYPELRASENFQQLQAQLGDTEDKIRVARQVYNDTVLTYENARETVPTNLVASLFSFAEKPFFEIEEPAREAPRVQF
jgi:LemA protein